MRRTRVIPVLLLKGRSLYKTRAFGRAVYIGDPINAVKIFNDKGVDELAIFDIDASRERRGPDLGFLKEFAEECFVPLCYGGGVHSVAMAESVFKAGVEKVSLNNALLHDSELLHAIAKNSGSQSVVAAVDVKRNFWGIPRVMRHAPTLKSTNLDLVDWVRCLEDMGAGEILLSSVDRDGEAHGYDLELIKLVSTSVDVPVIALGGARCTADFKAAVEAGATAVAAGQMFVFHGRHRAVLINYPSPQELEHFLP